MPRTDRLDSIFLKEISNIIQFGLYDPKVGFATVSEVKITPDLSNCKVYVSILGNDKAKKEGIEALIRSKGYIKTELAHRVNIRKIPNIEFVLDDSLDKAQRIEDIINKTKKSS